MRFTQEEMTAILRLAKLMAMADGKVTEGEINCIFADLLSFGVTANNLEPLEETANALEPTKAISIVAQMTMDEKKYVCGYLAAVMIADGNIDAKEQALWALVSALASFPKMTIAEAVDFWQKN